jgi:outer membrane biosynthesis protein TonB
LRIALPALLVANPLQVQQENLGEKSMKLAIGTALLVLLAGTTMYAQEQDKEKDKPAQQEEKKQEPAAKEHEQPKAQDQPKAQHQAQEQQKDQSKQDEKAKSDAAKQQQQAAHQQQQQAAKQQQQQQVARQDHPQNQQTQRDGANRNARRIPESDFHSHFGREHTFRVSRSDDRRFSYGGYYFVYNDPWPSGWAYTDDVYVDEIDGEYYLIDPVHPGIRLLVVVAS